MQPPHLASYFEAGDTIYLSGQLPIDDAGKVGGSSLGEQTEQTLRNIEKVLETLGLSKRNVVKSTVWLVPGSDFAEFNESYAGFFGEHRPARSTVFCGLALPGAKIEIEVIALRR